MCIWKSWMSDIFAQNNLHNDYIYIVLDSCTVIVFFYYFSNDSEEMNVYFFLCMLSNVAGWLSIPLRWLTWLCLLVRQMGYSPWCTPHSIHQWYPILALISYRVVSLINLSQKIVCKVHSQPLLSKLQRK